jgi:hypothetical protein
LIVKRTVDLHEVERLLQRGEIFQALAIIQRTAETSEGHPTDEVDTRIGVLEDALTRILNWADAYPLDVFPEPDFQAVQAALQKAGISLAQVSASNMRHVIQGVGDIARAALGIRGRAAVSDKGARL